MLCGCKRLIDTISNIIRIGNKVGCVLMRIGQGSVPGRLLDLSGFLTLSCVLNYLWCEVWTVLLLSVHVSDVFTHENMVPREFCPTVSCNLQAPSVSTLMVQRIGEYWDLCLVGFRKTHLLLPLCQKAITQLLLNPNGDRKTNRLKEK